MPDTSPTPPLPARYENGRFGPGNPGRRPGARGRMGHRVIMAILQDFMNNKEDSLWRARQVAGPAYLNAILKLLPAQDGFDPPDVQSWTDDEIDAALSQVRGALQRGGGARDALIDVAAVLMGDTPLEPSAACVDHRINGD